MRRRGEGTYSYPPEPGDLEPFRLGSGERGVLLIHGFCSTPPEMRGLGEHLARSGFRVHGALLKGHGTSPEDLETTDWKDWIDSAQAQLDDLRKECDQVFVAGQSMGGAVSLTLAGRNPDVVAIATLSALVDLGRSTEWQILLGRRLIHWHYADRSSVDLWDQEAVKKLRTYNKRSMKSHVDLTRLYRDALVQARQVRVPALVLHGMRDGLVPQHNPRLIADAIGPGATVRYFERSGHAMSVDVDQDEIFALITDHFLSAAAAAGVARTPTSSAAV